MKFEARPSFGRLMAIITALSWGVLAIGLKYTLAFASSGTIAQFRFVVAAFVLLVVFCVRGRILELIFHRDSWPALFLSSLCLAYNYFSYMKGIELTSATHSQIFIQTGPLSLLIFGITYFGESLGRNQILGILSSVIGFSLFYLDHVRFDESADTLWTGTLWIFSSAVSWATFAAIQKKLSQNTDTLVLNALTFLICMLALVPAADFSEWVTWSPTEVAILFVLGLNTILAYGCLNLALQHAPASEVSIIITCNPILTLILMNLFSAMDVHWLNPESQSPIGWLGAALVVLGVAIAQRKR